MTNQERLDKFKTLYRMREGFTSVIAITSDDKFLAAIYKKTEIVSKKTNELNVHEGHIFYCRVNTIQEYIEKLSPYIQAKAEVKQLEEKTV